MTRPAWLDAPEVQEAVARALDDAPPLSPDQLDMLRRTNFFTPAVARSGSSVAGLPQSSTDGPDRGAAASTRHPRMSLGEGEGPGVGPSASRRPAAPPTN